MVYIHVHCIERDPILMASYKRRRILCDLSTNDGFVGVKAAKRIRDLCSHKYMLLKNMF